MFANPSPRHDLDKYDPIQNPTSCETVSMG